MKEFSEIEMIESLRRSGYLLESEIARILSDAGFFIETNQAIEDPFTGKSREIDLIAEYPSFNKIASDLKCSTKIRFVFEIKNNNAPIVLLTEFKSSPNLCEWEALKEYITIPKNVNYGLDPYRDKILDNKSKYTQYCSFQRKSANSELMALHPDNIHSGISKINQFCDMEIGDREVEERANGYLRHFLYIPVLLIADDLYELTSTENNEPKLNKVDSSILVYNYYHKSSPSMTYVFVVTKQGFPDFMNSMLEIETEVVKELVNERNKGVT